MNLLKFVAILIISTSFLLTSKVHAQNIWLNDTTDFFAFEFVTPSLEGGNDNFSFLSGSYNLSYGKRLNSKTRFIVELPIVYAKIDAFGQSDSEFGIGNIYLGVRTGQNSNPLSGEFGVLLPTSSDDETTALGFGGFSDFNRSEAYIFDSWSLTAKLKYEKKINENGLYYKLRSGFLFSRDTDIERSRYYLDLAAQIAYRSDDNLNFIAGLSGRFGLNDETELDSDGDKSSVFFGVGVSYRTKNFEPGLTMRIPVDDPVKDFISNSIAINLLFHLN